MLEDAGGLPRDAVEGARLDVDIAGTRHPARATLRPLYDPARARILA
jgi:hypothetical protein